MNDSSTLTADAEQPNITTILLVTTAAVYLTLLFVSVTKEHLI